MPDSYQHWLTLCKLMLANSGKNQESYSDGWHYETAEGKPDLLAIVDMAPKNNLLDSTEIWQQALPLLVYQRKIVGQ